MMETLEFGAILKIPAVLRRGPEMNYLNDSILPEYLPIQLEK
jgi:hypothetical protein